MTDEANELREAARKLLELAERYPELFRHVLPLSDDDMATLRELAYEEWEPDDEQ